MEEDAHSNIYDDLPDFRYDKTLDELTATIARLEAENIKISAENVWLINRNETLEDEYSRLKTQFSSLLKTAKLEIGRKDRAIDDLRERLNKAVPQKKRFGVKRRGEAAAVSSPRKIPKVSPRKIPKASPRKIQKVSPRKIREGRREEIPTRKKESKPVDDVPACNDKVQSRLQHCAGDRGSLLPLKATEPSKDSNCAGSNVKMADRVLPAIDCPTVFSSRMYKRLYGIDHSPPLSGGPEPITDRYQSAVTGEQTKPQKFHQNGRPVSPNLKSFKRHNSFNPRSRVSSKDVKANVQKYLEGDSFSSSSDSSRSNSPVLLESNAVANPLKVNEASVTKTACTELTLEIRKCIRPGCDNSEHPQLQPSDEVRTDKILPGESKAPITQLSPVEPRQSCVPPLEISSVPVPEPSPPELRRRLPEKPEVRDEIHQPCAPPLKTSGAPVPQLPSADLRTRPPEKPEVPVAQLEIQKPPRKPHVPPPHMTDAPDSEPLPAELLSRPPEKPKVRDEILQSCVPPSKTSDVPVPQLPSADLRIRSLEKPEVPVAQREIQKPPKEPLVPPPNMTGVPVSKPLPAELHSHPPEKPEVRDIIHQPCVPPSKTSDVSLPLLPSADLCVCPPEKPEVPDALLELQEAPQKPCMPPLKTHLRLTPGISVPQPPAELHSPTEKSDVPIKVDKPSDPTPAKSDASVRQPLPAIFQEREEPSPVQSTHNRTENNSHKPTVEQLRAKSNLGLLTAGKTRQQTVAAIRPLQTLATAKPKATQGENKSRHTSNSAESKRTESPSIDKSNRFVPRLPGSAKGRAGKRVVVPPVQHMWRVPLANVSKNDGDGKVSREISVVKTVSVTSELTVRVDDMKPDELNTQFLFGSPVKWADDSLDSPKPETPVKSSNVYSIFGSSCHDLSNSPDPYLSVPPTAYEESCWATQMSDKFPKESPSVKPDTHKQNTSESSKETRLDEKARNEKATTTNPIFPPPSTSVIKKHVSIFSPVKDSKDSKHSLNSRVLDEPSRSNTGICFPISRYEDSVLGQFDDTAQFVSALAKVDTQISPLSTPVKAGNGSDEVVENPISFQLVFQKSLPEESPKNQELIADINCRAVENNDQSAAKVPLKDTYSVPCQGLASGQTIPTLDKPVFEASNPPAQKEIQPPVITVTPPRTDSSHWIIHRPNFASSTILSVKSWFPDAPVKMVVPRKTPRIVSNANRSASPKVPDVSSGARIAINDAFIIEQEERVRRWEQYDAAGRIGSSSPMKSPARKRIESCKISPAKRSPKKLACSSKIPKLPEVNKGVEPSKRPETPAVAVISNDPLNEKSSVNLPVPGLSETNLLEVPKAVESLPDSTQKILTMIGSLMVEAKPTVLKSVTSPADASKADATTTSMPMDSTSVVSQLEVVGHSETIDHSASETPKLEQRFSHSKPNNHSDSEVPTLEEAVVPSQALGTSQMVGITSNEFKERSTTSTAKHKPALTNKTAPADTNAPQCSPASPSSDLDLLMTRRPPSKHAAILVTRRPSTPLNKYVANLVKSSTIPKISPHIHITPSVPKVGNFKRSSALKPRAGEDAGKFSGSSTSPGSHQNTPMSSVRTNTRAQSTPKPQVRQKRTLLSNPANKVTGIPTYRSPDVVPRKPGECYHCTVDRAESDCAAGSESEVKQDSDAWKLIEVDEPIKQEAPLLKYNRSARPALQAQASTVGKPDAHEEESQGTPKHLMVSKVFPKVSLRTIMLDAPLKLSTPTKRKRRSGEFVGSPMIDENNLEHKTAESSKRKRKRSENNEPKEPPNESCITNSERLEHDGSSTSEVASQKSAKCDQLQQSKSQVSSRNSPECSPAITESSTTSEKSSRKSKRDKSPPRRLKRSRSTHQKSPEYSPARTESSITSEKSSRKSRCDESPSHRQRRSQSAHQKSPECSPARTGSSVTIDKSSRKLRRDQSPYRHLRRSRSTHQRSPECSPARTKSNESPAHHRRRSQSAHQTSPECSPARKESSITSGKSSWKSRPDEPAAHRYRSSRSAYNPSPELSPVRALKTQEPPEKCREENGSLSKFRKRSKSQGACSRSPWTAFALSERCDNTTAHKFSRQSRHEKSPALHGRRSRSAHHVSPKRPRSRASAVLSSSDDCNDPPSDSSKSRRSKCGESPAAHEKKFPLALRGGSPARLQPAVHSPVNASGSFEKESKSSNDRDELPKSYTQKLHRRKYSDRHHKAPGCGNGSFVVIESHIPTPVKDHSGNFARRISAGTKSWSSNQRSLGLSPAGGSVVTPSSTDAEQGATKTVKSERAELVGSYATLPDSHASKSVTAEHGGSPSPNVVWSDSAHVTSRGQPPGASSAPTKLPHKAAGASNTSTSTHGSFQVTSCAPTRQITVPSVLPNENPPKTPQKTLVVRRSGPKKFGSFTFS